MENQEDIDMEPQVDYDGSQADIDPEAATQIFGDENESQIDTDAPTQVDTEVVERRSRSRSNSSSSSSNSGGSRSRSGSRNSNNQAEMNPESPNPLFGSEPDQEIDPSAQTQLVDNDDDMTETQIDTNAATQMIEDDEQVKFYFLQHMYNQIILLPNYVTYILD